MYTCAAHACGDWSYYLNFGRDFLQKPTILFLLWVWSVFTFWNHLCMYCTGSMIWIDSMSVNKNMYFLEIKRSFWDHHYGGLWPITTTRYSSLFKSVQCIIMFLTSWNWFECCRVLEQCWASQNTYQCQPHTSSHVQSSNFPWKFLGWKQSSHWINFHFMHGNVI